MFIWEFVGNFGPQKEEEEEEDVQKSAKMAKKRREIFQNEKIS